MGMKICDYINDPEKQRGKCKSNNFKGEPENKKHLKRKPKLV